MSGAAAPGRKVWNCVMIGTLSPVHERSARTEALAAGLTVKGAARPAESEPAPRLALPARRFARADSPLSAAPRPAGAIKRETARSTHAFFNDSPVP